MRYSCPLCNARMGCVNPHMAPDGWLPCAACGYPHASFYRPPPPEPARVRFPWFDFVFLSAMLGVSAYMAFGRSIGAVIGFEAAFSASVACAWRLGSWNKRKHR